MKKRILSLSFLLLGSSQLFSQNQAQLEAMLLTNQTDSIFYYKPDGTKNWWYIQKDVFMYKKENNQAHSGNNPGVVNEVKYWQNEARKFNELRLNGNASIGQKLALLNQIRNNNQFEIFSIAITKNKNLAYDDSEYFKTDDLILITFKDPKVPQSQIDYLMNKYKLALYHAPSSALNNSVSWTYTFKVLSAKNDPKISFEVARQIFEQESNLVKISEPNIYGGSATSCDQTELSAQTSGQGDLLGTWFAKNTGSVVWSGINGTNDADADVCDCWGQGYTGKNIKVGIIDLGGFEFNHPDLASLQFVKRKEFNTTTQQYFTQTYLSNVYNPDGNGIIDGHGMQVAGIIGATPNNRVGNNQKVAIGTAFDADLIGYLMRSINSNEITMLLQEALIDNVDIVNMSFQLEYAAVMENEINNLVQLGRPNPNNNDERFGIIPFAGTGNSDDLNLIFPASLPNVIGVGGSDPNDRRSSYSSGYESWSTNSGVGSTYGPPEYNYDVVAPSDIILTTDLVGNNGLQGDYAVTLGTSFSSPITAGIAAIMLEKNPYLYFNQVRANLRNGAEKVNTGLYDYNQFTSYPGYSQEMFYGRVSCINSLNLTTVASINEVEKIISLVVHQKNETQFVVFLPSGKEFDKIEIVSILGQKIATNQLNNETQSFEIDLKNQANGMYFVNLKEKDKIIGTVKIIR